MYLLSKDLVFPPVNLADKNGLLAIGGDLSAERLLLAYKSGIFPWYNEDEPIIWYSPEPRMVLFPKNLKISKSMKQIIRKNQFRATFNQNFSEVISNCKNSYREGQGGTWITDEMEQAYINLHHLGVAKSVEVWEGNELVGGLYGIDLKHVFCGESMFSNVSNASKAALIWLCQNMSYSLIDCQVYTSHLEGLGAEFISRSRYLDYLKAI